MSLQAKIVLPDEFPALAKALQDAGLPADDIALLGRVFYSFSLDGQHIGYAGLEIYGPVALLRSVWVAEQHRQRGLGSRVVSEMERIAFQSGVESLHLLTKNQATFFERTGYSLTPRQQAPAAIAGTAQFQSLCPSSASYLWKVVGR